VAIWLSQGRGRAATLGCIINPLRGKRRFVDKSRGFQTKYLFRVRDQNKSQEIKKCLELNRIENVQTPRWLATTNLFFVIRHKSGRANRYAVPPARKNPLQSTIRNRQSAICSAPLADSHFLAVEGGKLPEVLTKSSITVMATSSPSRIPATASLR